MSGDRLPHVPSTTEPIEVPDATADPARYAATLIAILGDQDSLAVYTTTPGVVHGLCEGLDDAAWQVPLAPGEWNTTQVVGHLLDVDIVYGFRWRLALTEHVPAYPGYDEKAWSKLARPVPGDLLVAFDALRRTNVALLESLVDVDWSRRAVHGEQGTEDVRRMLDKIGGHDLAHLNQLRRTVAAARSR